MGRLHKTTKKYSLGRRIIGEKTFDQIHPIGSSMEKQYDATKAAEQAATAAANQKAIPLPDEEELERTRRRKNARRGGGRASTVLTEDDRLGG